MGPILICPLVGMASALQVAGVALFRRVVLFPLVALVNYQEGDVAVFCIQED